MNKRQRKSASILMVLVLLLSLLSPAANTTVQAETGVATDLIISEYIEGSSFNKAIELYNGTGKEIDLSGYTLEHYNNSGSARTGTTTTDKVLPLQGKLAAGATYVISRTDADAAIVAVADMHDESKSVINFNGNDQIVLKKNGAVVDSIGQVGSVANVLADVSLVRNSNILAGDTIIDDEFDPAKEWTNAGKNAFSNLGKHTFGEQPSEEEPSEPTEPTEPTEPETPVDTITVAEARKASVGDTVTIEGIATTNTGLWGYDTFYMQDDTAGMYVFSSPKAVQPGDKVLITGKLLTYKNELEIEPTSLEIISSNNKIPNAQVISPADVGEATQGELLKLENITITDLESDSYGTAIFQAKTESGDKVRVIHDNRTGSDYNELIKHYKEGDKVHLTGIGSIDNDGYHFKTYGLASYDLVNKPAVYVDQAQGTVPAGTKIELKTGLEGADIFYTTDGTEPTVNSTKYVNPIVLSNGETTIKAIAVDGENVSEVFSFTYTILNTEGLKIRDIQGKGHTSKYEGSSVKGITGVVTHIVSGSTFVIQDDQPDDDHTTSEAIQIFKSSHNVSVGDKVSVDGVVSEFGSGADLTKTEISASNVTKIGTAELPAPLVIGKDIFPPNKIIDNDEMTSFDPEEDGIDFWESVEFMRVSFPNAKVVGPPYSNDVPIIVESTTNNEINNQGGLNIAADDYNPEKVFLDNVGSNFRSGDAFDGDVVGVISYASTGYQVLTNKAELPKVIKSDIQPEVTHIEPAADKLTVAAYNIENFSNNKSNTPDEKVTRIAKTFVNNMKSPDIITLVEVQDNDGETDSGNTDASQSYKRLIEAIKANGGPAYEWTDVAPVNNENGGAPGGNIRVGYLYNPERTTLVDGTKGKGTEANGWNEAGNLTLNPGVIDPAKYPNTRKPIAAEFEFNGERVVVIGTHLNSKGGDQSLWGANQPPKLNSEAERHSLAQAINDFIDEGLAKNPDLNVVLAGDMNDFEFTKTFDILKGDVLTNMVDKVPANDRFSYFFQGNNQVLDHILVSNNLVDHTVADMIHINANYTEAQGRASDHDPVMIQVDLTSKESKKFDLTVLHTNDTHASLDNMPKTVTAVKEERAKDPNALLLNAGDVFSGTLYFNEFQGKADLALMNLMGYDAMTFGNHEFDLGSSATGHQGLVEFIKEAQFPFVSANVDFSKDEMFAGLFNDSITTDAKEGQIYNGIIKEINGEKVGIFGLTTEETEAISSPGSIAFENYLKEAEKAVKDFEAQGVNKIIAVTHIGYDDNAAIDNDLMLAKEVEGIDIIVGGHTHTTLSEPTVVAEDETPTVIVQTGNANSNLGKLNVEFDEAGVVVAQTGQLIAIGDQEADPEAVNVLAPFKEQVDKVAQEEIGVSTEVELENPRTNGDNANPSVRKNETILGNLITDGMLSKAKSFTGKNVIMALQNGGGIRAAINAGPITTGEVITVLPFGNTLATMEITGAELKEAFETSLSKYPAENGGFLHVAGGKVEFDSTKPAGERVVSVTYVDQDGNDVEVQDDETYTIATNAFTAKGGDGYDVFAKAYAEGRVTDLGLSDWENFRDHLVSLEAIPTDIEGRIIDTNDLPNNFGLTVLHTNDTHASLDNMPKTVTAVKEERAIDPNALLLNAGDVFSGTLYFNEFQGKADLALMNLMGYDAMTFGNHEFDLGSSATGHQGLVEFIKEAQFPFVSANVDFSKDELFAGLFNDSVTNDAQNGQIYNGIIKEINGEKVGIFGLTTEETQDISSPGSIVFENYLAEAEKAVKSFEAQGVNKIIALTHIGYDDNAAIDNDLILAEQVEGIDIIVGGHSHTTLTEPTVVEKDETPTVIVQTGNANSNLGKLNVEFDEAGVVVAQTGQLISIGDQEADPEAIEVLAPFKEQVDKVAQEEIGVSTEVELENPRTNGDNANPSVRKNETILGNLITDGMLSKAKSFTGKNVIMALQNGGGIRAAIDAGPITVGEVITVLPFGNTLATMEITGAELKEAFEVSFSKYQAENGGFLHVAGGKVEFDSTKPAGERVVSVKYLDENGEYVALQDNETYTIATNAFTAKGGDGYDVFAKAYAEGRVTDLGLSDWENFRDHLVSLEAIPTEVEGRIVDINDVPGGENPGGENPGGENPDGENPGGENPDGENPGGENPGGENPDGENPGGENPDGENPGGENPDGENPKGEKPGGESPGGKNPDGEKPNGENPGSNNPDGKNPTVKPGKSNNELPNTATDNFNIIVIGFMLILAGGVLFYVKRRKSLTN
ncbi:5'-nucleotidase C-terminal domain-containing protein [Metabacillus malikii]|uniref:LPXTG-motif cell wall-anchored protein n=1 Tax=Metabacillus malikii TaxID=1504265 RepID=A0ABT9ZIZ1_9BACI|nr:5'-nucleotidase C-terminal domain-containing protein [Metabacillus malikii]MDQ0231786.1 LPXTG-motif cell wall-anchored protein [Metabacillus malikii]